MTAAIISSDGNLPPGNLNGRQYSELILVDAQHRVILSPLAGTGGISTQTSDKVLVDEEHRLVKSPLSP